MFRKMITVRLKMITYVTYFVVSGISAQGGAFRFIHASF
jgi:hypothetical protein